MKNRQTGKRRMILGLLVIFGAIFSGCSSSPSNENSQTSQINRDMVPQPSDLETLVAPAELENTGQISKENFDKIKKGMTLQEVELIILGNSTRISSATENGKLIETYRWETADSARYIQVGFSNDKVVDKSQKGLK